MPSYSKGARGLSVLSRVAGIFTGTTNSLSLSPRQRPNRYAIHARRNLPDKEFRYLRTVIVTAAVYWGFSSMLYLTTNISRWPSSTGQASDSILPLTSSQSPVFLLNSRLGLFVETLQCFLIPKNNIHRRHSLSRSYGASLPSSLVIVISTPEHFQPVYLCRFAVRSLT